MPNKEAEIRRVFRLLTPDNRVNLLSCVHLAFFAENSARKSLGIDDVSLTLESATQAFCEKAAL
jgi:hypothetical protein